MNPLHLQPICFNGNFELLKLLIDNFKDRIYLVNSICHEEDVNTIFFCFMLFLVIVLEFRLVKLMLFTFKDKINISYEICFKTLNYACTFGDIELANFLFDNFPYDIDRKH